MTAVRSCRGGHVVRTVRRSEPGVSGVRRRAGRAGLRLRADPQPRGAVLALARIQGLVRSALFVLSPCSCSIRPGSGGRTRSRTFARWMNERPRSRPSWTLSASEKRSSSPRVRAARPLSSSPQHGRSEPGRWSSAARFRPWKHRVGQYRPRPGRGAGRGAGPSCWGDFLVVDHRHHQNGRAANRLSACTDRA